MEIYELNIDKKKLLVTLHWQYGWLTEMPLGGSNAIKQWFGLKELF
jgi:hypothetical protein